MQEMVQITKEEITADSLKVLFEIDAIKKSVPAELFLEQPGSSKEDYKPLLAQSKRALEALFYKNAIAGITEAIAIEITESAYEGDLREKEYAALKQDLVIDEFHFFEEELIIVFVAPKIFSNNTINVQLDYSLEIQDLSIDM